MARKKGSKPRRPIHWTKGRCRAEAKKYKTLKDFFTYCNGAYRAARRNGWIGSYDWLERRRPDWTEESVMEAARECINKEDLMDRYPSAWQYAHRHKLFGKMDWFIPWGEKEKRFSYEIRKKVLHLIEGIGISATREWMVLESGKEDVYEEWQRKLLKRWSGNINEGWASFKKYAWWNYPDMDWRKDREIGDDPDNLHLKP